MFKLYNTLTRKKEIFKPLHDKKVGFYTCGPTVYNYAQIGNLRTYIFEDILRRTLKYNGYAVKQVLNITDVEDKIIREAQKKHKTIKQITEPFTKAFFEDIEKLNIEKAEVYPRATDHIQKMISLIQKLLKKGVAYKGADGSIYFAIAKFKNYGKLSRLEKREIKIGARIAADEYNKDQAQDFVLWKAKKEGEPSWPAPFGAGRPGWHIECSAMSMKYLGESFDIHAGGVDLIFPHHENEIAQSEVATGKKFVRFWIEGEHLLVDGKKMSKSLKNFYTLEDLEKKGFDPLAFRYLVLNSHYRSKLNFTWKSLESAQKALHHIYAEWQDIAKSKTPRTKITTSQVVNLEKAFAEAIKDDLNTPKALAVFHRALKNQEISGNEKKRLLLRLDAILGLNLGRVKSVRIPENIRALAEKREEARRNKQFVKADELRKEIEKLGYLLEDTPNGPRIKRK